jgi:hypothetical protein
MSNIKKFNELLGSIKDSVLALGKLYYVDLQKDIKAEASYTEKTPFTRTMLRRLVSIAKGDLLPESFFMVNAVAYRMLSTMSIEQQERALHEKFTITAEDGSHWLKKFEDLSPRQMNMVYDQRAKAFRGDVAQKEWLKANPVVKIANAGTLDPIEPVKAKVEKKPTKAALIRQLKDIGVEAKDLAKIADAAMLMEAAQLALSKTTAGA